MAYTIDVAAALRGLLGLGYTAVPDGDRIEVTTPHGTVFSAGVYAGGRCRLRNESWYSSWAADCYLSEAAREDETPTGRRLLTAVPGERPEGVLA